MGIALFTLSSLFDLIAPLQSFFMGHPGQGVRSVRNFASGAANVRTAHARTAGAASTTCARQPSPAASA